jgi:flagellar hook-length control protein FliK
MQTTQVSNAANVLTTTSAPTKQSETNAAPEPFGKVLSREVSQRNGANEAPRNKEASAHASGQNTAKAPGKASEAKSAREGKPADKTQADDNTVDAPSALPEELLALVANLNDMTMPTTPVGEVQAIPADQLQQDAKSPATPVALPIAAIPTDAKPAESAASPTVAVTASDAQTTASVMPAAGSAGKPEQASALPKQADTGKTELPVATAQDKTSKVDELTAQAANRASAARVQEFTAALSESTNVTSTGMQPVQQSALNALQQQVANTAERLTPRVGTPAWDQALGQKVVWMVAGEQQSASLTLNPPDLGPLQVVLNVSNSQANATFIAAQPEVRQALEAALPKLRDMLGEAGIQLGQASVNSGAPNQQGSFDQAASHSARSAGQLGDRESSGSDTQVRVSRVQQSSSGLGLVDTFV